MKVLVTGGAGYIGSHFCKWATQAGHETIVYDNLSTGHREFVKFGPFVEGDIRDTEKVYSTLRTHSIEAVVHFAASALVAESMQKPDFYYSNNVEGTASLLKALRKVDVDKVLMSSTSTIYGKRTEGFLTESTPCNPINPYGETKKACEDLMLKFHEDGGSIGILRYFNVVGRDPEGELWEWHEPETHLIPSLVAAIKGNKPFNIFGTDFPTKDGTCVRDYIDVNDLAQVHIQALELKQSKLISNVGRGQGYSVKEVVTTAEKVLNQKAKINICDRRPGDPPHLVADNTFFRSWCNLPLTELEDSIRSL